MDTFLGCGPFPSNGSEEMGNPGFTIDEEEFRESYQYGKVRGYVDFDGTWDDDEGRKREVGQTWVVFNQTLTPSAGGDKAVYRECSSEAEAIAIVRILNSIFESFVTVEFDLDEEEIADGREDVMTYEHQMVTWVYA